MKFNNETIREAVKQWLENKESAIAKYGHISGWDTSQVTDMSKLFFGAKDFNEPIGSWDTSNVTNMHYIFNGAFAFNQPLGDWDVSSVTDMAEMHAFAAFFGTGSGIIDSPFDKDEKGEYMFDGWDKDYLMEQIEEEPAWYEDQDSSKTLTMGLVFCNIQFSEHPRIAALGNEASNNDSDFINKYEKCLKGEFSMPTALKKHIKVIKYDFGIDHVEFEDNYLTLDVVCHVTFKITSSLEEAIAAIDQFQQNNHDLRWDVSIYWS